MNVKLLAIIKREYLQQVRTKGVLDRDVPDPDALPRPHLHPGRAQPERSSRRAASASSTSPAASTTDRRRVPGAARGRGRAEERGREEKEEKLPGAQTLREGGPERRSRRSRRSSTSSRWTRRPRRSPSVRKRLNEDVQKERIKAYIVLTPQTLETGAAEWRAQSVKAEVVMREQIANYLSRAATKERLKDRGVDPKVYEAARLRVDLEAHEAKEIESGESGKNVGMNLAISAVFFFLIYMSIFIYGAYIMRGVLEEKNNRIVEVIVSSVRPTTLMLGKILGIGARRPHAVLRLGLPLARDRAARRRGRRRHGRRTSPHSGRHDRRVRPLLPARVLPLRVALRGALGALQHGAGGAAVRDDSGHDARSSRPRRGSSRSTSRTARSRRCSPSSRSRRRS